MNIVQHLIEVVSALDELKVRHLVMGGHAVRYYGFNRDTTDHDLHIPIDAGQHLSELLSQTTLFVSGIPTETPTWRGEDFRRFVLGTLPDGKEELLEFWIRNHLLDDFESLYQRREVGIYGERQVSFLSLPDLLRSKETERDNDWDDIKILEDILDQRNIAAARRSGDVVAALASLRSIRGLDSAFREDLLADSQVVATALRKANNPITYAYLLPFAPAVERELPSSEILVPLLRQNLAQTMPCSTRHQLLIEAVRLRYKRTLQEIDRQEKINRRRQL
ncbi:MAG: hypothetical protein ABI977_32325 [Acidobacteriota bacterium]